MIPTKMLEDALALAKKISCKVRVRFSQSGILMAHSLNLSTEMSMKSIESLRRNIAI